MRVVPSAVTEALKGVLPDPEERAAGSGRGRDVSGRRWRRAVPPSMPALQWVSAMPGAGDCRQKEQQQREKGGTVPQHQGLLCVESLLELSVALSSDS